MKNTIFNISLFCLSMSSVLTFGQAEKCQTMHVYNQHIQQDPQTETRMQNHEQETQNWISANSSNSDKSLTRSIITIPVVVHVIYKTNAQNISDAQINSQIVAMNKDFRLLNQDSLPTSHPFWAFTADSQIEFCLANRDPNGNPTTGINRVQTNTNSFNGNGNEKSASSGGADNWNPTKYLNIWVCNLGSGLLGYATFPSDLNSFPGDDGVVIGYNYFGTTGTVSSPFNKGRTVTHEVGHWLNLRHIWGDNNCGNDLVSDTKVAQSENYGCPNFPRNANSSCSGSDANGEMYMNYMDYVDDACMKMFTFGQADRMRAALNSSRAGLLTSLGCAGTADVSEILNESNFTLYPNPTNDVLVLNAFANNNFKFNVQVTSLIGEKMSPSATVNSFPYELNVSDFSEGTYFVQISNGTNIVTKKFTVIK